ncbi:TonB-dependent receptor [Roseateles sp. DAIF2]|uniref:TonB-dependent receptor domain-containing protein n=1 Tax=Roseateles sp. DAIF2 TaxID=2714952 RepID=UPI00201D6623|nr:TonB-dependent receptor [Roseateles sp. DAIF2]
MKPPLLRPLAVALSLALVGLSCAAQGNALATPAAAAPQALNIPALPAAQSLQQLIEQTRIQLIYSPDLVRGLITKAVNGSFTPLEALNRMLDGSGLQAVETGANALTIRPAASSSPRADKVQLDSVVVSASRRNEPVREVPMQVSVVGGEQLQRKGARSLQDYLAGEAGVDVKSMGGAGVGTVSIRGVTTGTQTIATVGIYVDDVAFGSSGPFASGPQMALDMGLLDLKHVEVLRGPQGTLYGAGAMGGLLKYVTHEPDTYELSGRLTLGASATRGGGPGHTVGAVLNVPLKEDVAGLRVSAFNEHFGGTVDTIGQRPRSDNDRGDTRGLRASLLVTPVRQMKLRFTGTTQKIRRDGTDFVEYRPSDSEPLHAGGRQRRLREPEPYDVKIDLLSADLEYDFGWARLNSISSRQKVASHVQVDLSESYVPMLAGLGLNLGSAWANTDVTLDKTTQELRLTSKSDKTLEWLLGFYWDDEASTNDQLARTTLPGGAPGPQLFTAGLPARFKEIALYGDLTWKSAAGLALTGGLRVARNKQRYTQLTEGLLAGGKQALEGASSETSRTWLLTARYALDKGSDVYLRGATGYRPGGPNAVLNDPVTGAPTGPNSFRHDALTSVEAGYKADLLDKRLSLEAAAFDIRWKDLQQFMPSGGVTTIVNAGAARVRGAELVASWRPDARWTLAGNAAYIDARLSEDAPGLGAKAGARLPSSARFSASLSANYAFELSGRPSYVGLTQRHVGERRTGFEGSAALPLYRLPAYAMTDLQAGIDFGRLQLALYVRNLFDRAAQLAGNNILQPFGGPGWVSLAPPRTLGATLTLPF